MQIRQLEVRMRIHQGGEDGDIAERRGVGASAIAESGYAVTLDRHEAVANRRTCNGEYPGGGEDRHREDVPYWVNRSAFAARLRAG